MQLERLNYKSAGAVRKNRAERPTRQADGAAPETAQCDCCGDMKPRDEISRIWAFGIETFACDECRHDGVMPARNPA